MSFYTSLTGLNAATTELSVTSNNIANAGTSGFKRSEADFGDILRLHLYKKLLRLLDEVSHSKR